MKPKKPARASKSAAKPKTAIEYQQQIGELTAHLQRLQAEFENYKKRQMDERAELMSNAKEAVLGELLPALDNFDLAAAHLPEDLKDNSWAQGMQYVGQQLVQTLDNIGVKKIEPLGSMFDHNQHEAVEHTQSDKPEGTITEVIAPGYQIGEKVVRPARVKVSGGNVADTAANQKTNDKKEV